MREQYFEMIVFVRLSNNVLLHFRNCHQFMLGHNAREFADHGYMLCHRP